MKLKINNSNKYLLLFIFLFTISLQAQSKLFQQKEIPRDSILKVAHLIIDSAKCKVLITVDDNGTPHAREMAPFPVGNDMKIWFGTFPSSRKVKQILGNPSVAVFYYDSNSQSYVAINGIAKLVNDKDNKDKYWIEGWKVFYPDKDKDYILIEVVPEKLEVCSFRYKFFWSESGVPLSVEFREN
jgi:general stress protein 26